MKNAGAGRICDADVKLREGGGAALVAEGANGSQ